MKPWTGIALMHEPDFIASALPLFEAGEIEVLEWSFDTIRSKKDEPDWLPLLLNEYSQKGRLLGHGVRYSLLSGDFSKKQDRWLKQLASETRRYTYRHITEHFGFMTSGHFHKGAPLPVPLNAQTLAIGRDRLQRLQQASGISVGIENLAFAFSVDQVKKQAEFLEKLVEPVEGFLILDLHNLWCQSINFDIHPEELINAYPLHLVKEIHISGGSWSTVSNSDKLIRRDTHDDTVPEEVLRLLAYALPKCPKTEAVIFERLGNTLLTSQDQLRYMADYKAVKQIVDRVYPDDALPKECIQKSGSIISAGTPVVNNNLTRQQQRLVKLLTQNKSIPEIIADIKQHKELRQNDWNTYLWTDDMIETAVKLTRKWN